MAPNPEALMGAGEEALRRLKDCVLDEPALSIALVRTCLAVQSNAPVAASPLHSCQSTAPVCPVRLKISAAEVGCLWAGFVGGNGTAAAGKGDVPVYCTVVGRSVCAGQRAVQWA